MLVQVIKSEEQYQAVMKRIEEIFHSEPGSKEGDELELLVLLAEAYEEKNHPIGMPDPIEAIKFRMDQLGIDQKDMSSYLGYKGRVSEILNRKRSLTLNMIRVLSSKLSIPAEVLIQPYDLST
jgi:HTH-type transcriptional regulator/antitoxin HigA